MWCEAMPNEKAIYKSRKHLLRNSLIYFSMLPLGLVFWGLALWGARGSGFMIISGALALPIIGLYGGISRLLQLHRPRPLLTLSPDGLRYAKWGKRVIPWRAIVNGGVVDVDQGVIYGNKRHLYIMVDNKYITGGQLPRKLIRRVRENRRRRWPDLLIDLSDSDTSPEEAFELVRQYRALY